MLDKSADICRAKGCFYLNHYQKDVSSKWFYQLENGVLSNFLSFKIDCWVQFF